MNRYRKAIVAFVGFAVALAGAFGVDVAEDVSESAITLATAILVLLVPNE